MTTTYELKRPLTPQSDPSEVRAEWVDALRSGQYQQATGQLKKVEETGDSFCCLGVLCDLAAKAGLGQWSSISQYTQFVMGKESNLVYPPLEVAAWVGDSMGLGLTFTRFSSEEGNSLSGLNDAGGWSFDRIADLIEAAP